MRCKRLNGRLNFYARMTIVRALPRKRFHQHGFLCQTTRFEVAKSPIATSLPQRACFWPQDSTCSRVIFPSSRNAP
jgi:hypothetical protein